MKTARTRRIVAIGNCQMGAMVNLYRRYVAVRTGDILEHVPSYQGITPEARSAIEQADVVVEQLFDLKQQADTEAVATSAPRLFIPMVTAAFLWPFAGQPHPKNTSYPFLLSGPYGGEAGDSFLNRMILTGVQPEEAVDTYTNLDVRSRVNLDRMYELVIDRQRSRDEAAGYRTADMIERHFRSEQIFLSPYHPNVRVAVALATQFFEHLGAERADIERMQNCTRVSPFPKDELPLHPSVCRHFGLDFIPSDRRYRFMNEGYFTFREYMLRYMRYEWNERLEEGMSLIHAGLLDDRAREQLELGLEQSPRSAAGYNALSHVHNKLGMQEKAVSAARRAVALEPDSAPYQAQLGNLLRQAGQLDEAEAALLAAIAADAGEPHYLDLLAELRKTRGPAEASNYLVRAATRLDSGSEPAIAGLVNISGAPASQVDPIADMNRVLAANPDDAASHDRLAQMLGRLNRIEEAVAVAQNAVKLGPAVARFHITLSSLLLRQNLRVEALSEAHAAAVSEPVSVEAHAHLGHLLLRHADDHQGAEQAFRRAVELAPEDAHMRHELSVSLRQQQRFDEAVAAAREAADLQSNNPHRFIYLAALLAQTNDPAGAEVAQRRAVDLEPETTAFRVVLSDLLARRGRLDEALTEARIAVEHDPKSAHALGHLAHVTQLVGDLEPAEIMLRDAIRIEPHNGHLRNQLARLESRKARVHAG